MQETDSAEATAGLLVRVVNPKWKFRLSFGLPAKSEASLENLCTQPNDSLAYMILSIRL